MIEQPRSGSRVAFPDVGRTQRRSEGGALAPILSFSLKWHESYWVLRQSQWPAGIAALWPLASAADCETRHHCPDSR